jgi:hypothetical protein
MLKDPAEMRGLKGDFATMPLKDLVVYLGNQRASGTLALEREGVRKWVELVNGLVVKASSNQRREYLGQFLINLGHISEDQFIKAYETQKETKVFLGKILALIGLVSEKVILNGLSLKFRETLLEAFRWETGVFTFEPSNSVEVPDELELQIDLLDIHREGEFRETAWRAIRSVFSNGQVRLLLKEDHLPEPPEPGTLDFRLIALIKEGATIDEMILALHATDFYLYQRLYALYRLDAVTPLPPELAGQSFVEMAAGEDLFTDDAGPQVQQLLKAGQPWEAETAARKARRRSRTPESAELLREAENALLTKLRQDLMGKEIPVLLVTAAELKSLSLSAPEKYLLSRINGTRTLSSIVHASPIQELEALKFLQGFIDNKLVKLG